MATHSRKSAADDEAPSVRWEAKEVGLRRAGVISLAPARHNCNFCKLARIRGMSVPARSQVVRPRIGMGVDSH